MAFGSTLVSTVCTVVVLLSAARPSFAASCSDIFNYAPAKYGTMRKDFRYTTEYTVEVRGQSKVTDQCALGTCHLHSWTAQLEQSYKARTGKSMKLSTHFLSASHFFQACMDALDKTEGPIDLSLGENVFGSRRAILKYGLRPEIAWSLGSDFQNAPTAGRIEEYATNIIARARWEKKSTSDKAKRARIEAQARLQIIEIFKNVVGSNPNEFTYQGKTYTPMSFRAKFFPELSRPVVSLSVDERKGARPTLISSGESYALISADISALEATAKRLLDRGENVRLAYAHNRRFVDSDSGVMSISAFSIPDGGAPLSREQQVYFQSKEGLHAVQIVGYDLDPTSGKVTKWKIKNSWGTDMGDRGYFHMFADYFETFARSISYFGTPGDGITPAIDFRAPVQLDLPLAPPVNGG